MQTESLNFNAASKHQHSNNNLISVPLLNLPLRPSTLAHLLRCGFASTADVAYALKMSAPLDNNNEHNVNKDGQQSSHHKSSVAHFAKELGCNLSKATDYTHELDDALDYVGLPKVTLPDEAQKGSSYMGQTAAAILKSKRYAPGTGLNLTRQIVSFCMPVDQLLGGGIPLSELTEFVGLPGSGKTQLAMQLAVDARLPAKQGGVEGCTVVIDSEGSWCGAGTDRLWSMATSLVDHVKGSAKRRAEAKRARESASTSFDPEESLPEWFTAESILDGIHIFRVHEEATQTATMHSLPRFLLEQEKKGKPVKLVVVDSMAFHYRAAASASRSKNRSIKKQNIQNTYNLTRMATFLSQLASEFELAVVAINHMTTRFDCKDTSGSGTKLVPALGESWAHTVTSRIIIDYYRRDSNPEVPLADEMKELRTFRLVKSPHKPPGTALFTITDKGIRSHLASQQQKQQQQKKARLDD